MKITEVTGDDKFDSMLKGITTSSDTQKYNQMMGNITAPATYSPDDHSNPFFFLGDRVMERLQELVARRTPEDKALMDKLSKMSLNDVNAWIANDIGVEEIDINDINDAIHSDIDTEDLGYHKNLVEFPDCKDVREFKINYLNGWIDYKNRGGTGTTGSFFEE